MIENIIALLLKVINVFAQHTNNFDKIYFKRCTAKYNIIVSEMLFILNIHSESL